MKITFQGEEVEIVAANDYTTRIRFVDDAFLSWNGDWIYRELVLSNKRHKGVLFCGGVCIH